MYMKILKTYRHARLDYIETKYKKSYPTLLLKQAEFFNSITNGAFVPVHIGYVYHQTTGEIS